LLVFFTDGVTEAEDQRTQQFGETRLVSTLNRYAGISTPVLLPMILQDLDRFVGDAPQHDDITLMLVKAV
jgi:sigma-B regulation protein RsbU (phosphoserine phosphatase)